MNKKASITFLLFLFECFTLAAQQPTAADAGENDFRAASFDGDRSVEIISYRGTAQSVRIPQRINGMPVTSIGENAFFNRGISSVSIPAGVSVIGQGAFFGNRIVSITIGANVVLHFNGSFGHGFEAAYAARGRAAGTYTRPNADSSAWVRQ